MCTRRVCSMLCAVICAGILMLGLENRSGAAGDKEHVLLPVADGNIFDQSPFDGIADGVEDELFNTVFLTSGLGESRAALEFDLSNINPHRIESAFLRVTPLGKGILPGTLTVPVQLFGYQGDGSIQNGDFNAGCFITLFDGLAAPATVPVSLDVTEFLRSMRPGKQTVAGFTLRTNVHGSQINFGSVEQGFPPTLLVTLK